jgi:hypothetical protein
LVLVLSSQFRFKVIKSKAFLISQALVDANIDISASALGLDGFRKLLSQNKQKERDPEKSGTKKKKKKKKKKTKKKQKKGKNKNFFKNFKTLVSCLFPPYR